MKRLGTILLAVLVCFGAATTSVHAAGFRQQLNVRVDDGTRIYGVMDGEKPVAPRPLIIEFTPYALMGSGSTAPAGKDYNRLTFHTRGTGRSAGSWDLFGDRDQRDIAFLMDWACKQSFSNGKIAIFGSSASAIAAYGAMRRKLACLRTAVLVAGTSSMYRDIGYPGGVAAVGVGALLLGLVAQPWATDLQDHLQRDPAAIADAAAGFARVPFDELAHPTEDAFWKVRDFHNPITTEGRVPLLAVTSFYDIQPRGAFEAYRATRRLGSHIYVVGAHDGFVRGVPDPWKHKLKPWLDHFLLGKKNGIRKTPSFQAFVGRGSNAAAHAGDWVKVSADKWPVRGTMWKSLHFGTARSGSAGSLNDGVLTDARPTASTRQIYPSVTSMPTASDPHLAGALTTLTLGGVDVSGLLDQVPFLTQMDTVEPLALTYTTPPLTEPLLAVGPASLDLFAATTSPGTDYVAVLADVAPDGAARAVGAGRLNSAFPGVIKSRSLLDPATGAFVQPYGDYSHLANPAPGKMTPYHVEFWPLGNEFGKGHRLRVYLVGTPATQHPALPALNFVGVGGATASRLMLPVLNGCAIPHCRLHLPAKP